jgi:hypothetical protein
MAEKKLLKSVRVGGVMYTPTSTADELEKLDTLLSAKEVQRLTDKEVLSGFTGQREEAQPATASAAVLANKDSGTPARPQGVQMGDDGEPNRSVAPSGTAGGTKPTWLGGGTPPNDPNAGTGTGTGTPDA